MWMQSKNKQMYPHSQARIHAHRETTEKRCRQYETLYRNLRALQSRTPSMMDAWFSSSLMTASYGVKPGEKKESNYTWRERHIHIHSQTIKNNTNTVSYGLTQARTIKKGSTETNKQEIWQRPTNTETLVIRPVEKIREWHKNAMNRNDESRTCGSNRK